MRRRRKTSQPNGIGKVPKDYRDVIEAAEAQGFRLERRPGGHLALYAPTPPGMVIFGSSPRDGGRHSKRKVIADLRRHGFVWPPPP